MTKLLSIADDETKAYIQTSEDLATLRNSPHISRKNFKKIFRTVVHNNFLINQSRTLDIHRVDQHKWTYLHHAAMYKPDEPPLYKICARLGCLGADTGYKTVDGKLPFGDSKVNLKKITALQMGVDEILVGLEKSPPDIICESFISHAGTITHVSEALKELYQSTMLKPLMELAKLACLGWHDFTEKRKKRDSDPNYDSDNDDLPAKKFLQPEREVIRDDKFKIYIDVTNERVERICYFGINGRAGEGGFGVFQRDNQIYVAGQRANMYEARGTFIHELTHFVVYEVYMNDCKPYTDNDLSNKNLFSQIVEELKSKQEHLPNRLSQVFRLYFPYKYPNELIVRVAEMFAEDPDNARAILERDAPRLLKYYETSFLPAVRAHCYEIEQRVLSGWPKEMFAAARSSKISFEHA